MRDSLNTEGLRYDKVILATDADVDGLHIRNLMITYFFKFFEQLFHDGPDYILETPLFRVRNKHARAEGLPHGQTRRAGGAVAPETQKPPRAWDALARPASRTTGDL